MKEILAAFHVEILKISHSKILPISIYLFLFIGAMMGLLMFVSAHPEIAGRSAAINAKTSFLGGSDWTSYFSLLIQIALTIGVIGSGIITSWVFGREFNDKVVKDLLALPLSRANIVISKLIILFAWSILLSVTILLAAMITGFIVRIPGWTPGEFFPFVLTYFSCSLLNALLITPVSFVASTGRGYLLPVSFVILIMILTQILFVGLPRITPWFPWALPALISGVAGESLPIPGFCSILIYTVTILVGLVGTIGWWVYADHK